MKRSDPSGKLAFNIGLVKAPMHCIEYEIVHELCHQKFPNHDREFYRLLERLENAGVLVSREAGRTVLYEFNPRYALLEELDALLEKALSFYPEELQEALLKDRRHPRRRGKPLP